jgi:hypothetical protein
MTAGRKPSRNVQIKRQNEFPHHVAIRGQHHHDRHHWRRNNAIDYRR